MTGFEELKYAVEIEQAMESCIGHLWANSPEIASVFFDLLAQKRVISINIWDGFDIIYTEPNNSFIHGTMYSYQDAKGVTYPCLKDLVIK